ncbi:MAG: glycosyltransferase family 39 protein [Candidatus Promineifilaceae bacterium]
MSIINLTLCGVNVFWLAKELIKDERIAFFSGVIYLAWPHRMTQPSHPNLMSTWAIPLFLLFLTRLVKNKRWQDGFLAGLALALVGYIRWQLLIGAVLVGGLYLLFILPGNLNRDTLRGLILSGIVAVVAILPPMLLLAGEWRSNPTEFYADRGFVNIEQMCDFRLVVSCFHKRINLVSLFLGKLGVGSHRCSFDLVGLRSSDATAAYLLSQPSKLHL